MEKWKGKYMSLFDKIIHVLKPHVNAGVLDTALSAALADVAQVVHDEIVKTVNKAAAPKPPKPAAGGNGNTKQ